MRGAESKEGFLRSCFPGHHTCIANASGSSRQQALKHNLCYLILKQYWEVNSIVLILWMKKQVCVAKRLAQPPVINGHDNGMTPKMCTGTCEMLPY